MHGIGEKEMRKFLATLFALIGVPIFCLSLAIRYGLSDANKMIKEFQNTIRPYKDAGK